MPTWAAGAPVPARESCSGSTGRWAVCTVRLQTAHSVDGRCEDWTSAEGRAEGHLDVPSQKWAVGRGRRAHWQDGGIAHHGGDESGARVAQRWHGKGGREDEIEGWLTLRAGDLPHGWVGDVVQVG
jgi:hypothetical protein